MALVSPTRWRSRARPIRTGTAQADTGQTDWIAVPNWAKTAIINTNLTATAGTTPGPVLVHLKRLSPSAYGAPGTSSAFKFDDSSAVTIMTNTVGLTAATGNHRIVLGPGVGLADVTNTADNKVNAVLPQILGIQVVLDRTDGSETYTYTVSVDFTRN